MSGKHTHAAHTHSTTHICINPFLCTRTMVLNPFGSERERKKHRDRETQIEKLRGRETERERHGLIKRDTYRRTARQIDRETERESKSKRDRDREKRAGEQKFEDEQCKDCLKFNSKSMEEDACSRERVRKTKAITKWCENDYLASTIVPSHPSLVFLPFSLSLLSSLSASNRSLIIEI